MSANGYGVSFRGDGNVLKLILVDVSHPEYDVGNKWIELETLIG